MTYRYTSIAFDDQPVPGRAIDIFQPVGEPRPVAIFLVHGGGWRQGSRANYHALMSAFRLHGYICASTDYRLEGVDIQAQIADIRLGYSIFRQELAGRPVVVLGASAGGHLAALLATIQPGDRLGDSASRLEKDTRPAAVACYNPVLDFLAEPRVWPHQLLIFHGIPETLSEDYHKFSPARRVTGVEPPFLFLYGDRDILTPEQKSRAMLTRLAGYGIPVEAAFFHRMEHGFGYRLELPEQQRAARVVAEFFERRLK